MKYKNIKTGVLLETTSKIIGDAWKPVEEIKQKEPVTKEEYVEEEVDLEAMTNKELEEFAKEHNIELTTEDKKNKDTRIAAIVKAFE